MYKVHRCAILFIIIIVSNHHPHILILIILILIILLLIILTILILLLLILIVEEEIVCVQGAQVRDLPCLSTHCIYNVKFPLSHPHHQDMKLKYELIKEKYL